MAPDSDANLLPLSTAKGFPCSIDISESPRERYICADRPGAYSTEFTCLVSSLTKFPHRTFEPHLNWGPTMNWYGRVASRHHSYTNRTSLSRARAPPGLIRLRNKKPELLHPWTSREQFN